MKRSEFLQIFGVGIALFSMFFGGGNLTFPLWIGSEASFVLPTILGFIGTGVLLPFLGVVIGLYFHGHHEKYLSVFGKSFGTCLIFCLLLFWIPFGSGPRCNHLAYGAFSQIGGTLPFWVYSVVYSFVVFILACKRNRILDILGKVITPALLSALAAFIYLGVSGSMSDAPVVARNAAYWSDFFLGVNTGYLSQDFIASIFFTSSVLALIKENRKKNFSETSVLYSFLVGIILLSLVYIGMIFVGNINGEVIREVSRDQLLVALGRSLFDARYHFLISTVITLSVLTTSVALALVYADYLRLIVFRKKISHAFCVALALLLNFSLSMIGFEPLAQIISWAMAILYPLLLITTVTAVVKDRFGSPGFKLQFCKK